jgi:hypothetical protein
VARCAPKSGENTASGRYPSDDPGPRAGLREGLPSEDGSPEGGSDAETELALRHLGGFIPSPGREVACEVCAEFAKDGLRQYMRSNDVPLKRNTPLPPSQRSPARSR